MSECWHCKDSIDLSMVLDDLGLIYCIKCRNKILVKRQKFLRDLKTRNKDSLLYNIFLKANIVMCAIDSHSSGSNELYLRFNPKFSFFKKILQDTMPIWMPSARFAFGKKIFVIPFFLKKDHPKNYLLGEF